jgi:hypothetical protein
MEMLKFTVAALLGASLVLLADQYANEALFRLGSLLASDEAYAPHVTNYIYKLFMWACLFAAILVVTPKPKSNWPSAIVCGLILAVALYQGRELTVLTVANGQTQLFWWGSTLAVFAVPLFLTWKWYKRVIGTSS